MIALLAGILSIVALVCWIIVVIDAFKDSVLKGLATVFCCGLYWLYYAFFEFQHQNKWAIVLGGIIANIASGVLWQMSGMMPVPGTP
jgi:hypothetical protein